MHRGSRSAAAQTKQNNIKAIFDKFKEDNGKCEASLFLVAILVDPGGFCKLGDAMHLLTFSASLWVDAGVFRRQDRP